MWYETVVRKRDNKNNKKSTDFVTKPRATVMKMTSRVELRALKCQHHCFCCYRFCYLILPLSNLHPTIYPFPNLRLGSIHLQLYGVVIGALLGCFTVLSDESAMTLMSHACDSHCNMQPQSLRAWEYTLRRAVSGSTWGRPNLTKKSRRAKPRR